MNSNIITVLMIYVLLVLSETLLEYSHVLTDRIDDVKIKLFILTKLS